MLLTTEAVVTDVPEKKEKGMLARIADGTVDRSWVDAALRAKGAIK